MPGPMVYVVYADDTRARFASQDDAEVQSRHDLVQPGHVDPVRIVEDDGDDAAEGRTLMTASQLKKLAKCDCPLCEWHLMGQAKRERNTHLHPTVPRES